MKTVLEEFCDMWVNQMPEEGESSTIEVDWYEISGILSELIEKNQQIKNNVVLADVVEQSEQLSDHQMNINNYCKYAYPFPPTGGVTNRWLDGDISFVSKLNIGITFSVKLPL